MKIALAGNPNSGKTTVYNALTGSNEKVGNWAGVTVGKKERSLKKAYCKNGEKHTVIDLPGAYSISPFTKEESITIDYIRNEKPDVIVNIVDATNLRRSLFFTTQLLELGIPVVIGLNKNDVREKKNIVIDIAELENKLGYKVIEIVATKSDGLDILIENTLAVGRVQDNHKFEIKAELYGDTVPEEADRKRYEYVNGIMASVVKDGMIYDKKLFGDKVDIMLTNKWFGIPFFAAVMWLVFQISQVWVGAYVADFLVGWLEVFQGWTADIFASANPLVLALLVDGVIGGVIAVIGFLPLVMVMYFLIAILEDCGYMSRVAVLLDPIFKKVGLSGKSVIPFVITIGCAVPGIMASRTIRDERERRATAMLAPFIPCGAKIPVISLFAGAFFDNAGWVSTIMYLSGIALVFVGAVLVNKIAGYKVGKSFFIIELPDYKIPSVSAAFRSMCSRGWAYVVKAATIILLCNTAVQIMQTFTFTLSVAEKANESILAFIAAPVAYLLVPIVGVFSWQLAAAAVTGFIAKENVVGTLAVCFVGLDNLIDTEELALMEGAGASAAGVMAITKAAALAYLMFNLYTPPCFAAIGAMNSEMKSGKWLALGIGLQFGIGYTVSYFVYTIGTIINAPDMLNIQAALLGLGMVLAMVCAVSILIIINNKIKIAEAKIWKQP